MSYSLTVDMAMWNSVIKNKYTNSMMLKYGSSILDVSIVLIMYSKLVLSEPKYHRNFVGVDIHVRDWLKPEFGKKFGF